MFDRIINARNRLKGYARITPTLTSGTLNAMVDADIFLKCENFQNTGAFKFRGAFNSMSTLSEQERAKGVVTYSSGNHAQAVALVGKMLHIQTFIVMPDTAPAIKLAATKGYGANVIEYNPQTGNRQDIAETLQRQKGLTMIPPFDHEDVIAGQGTATLELFEQAGSLDLLLAPCGGGGLLSGSAIAAKALNPSCTVVGVEPQLADDACRSFKTKRLHTIRNPQTIADGTRTPCLGKITFPLVLNHVDDMVSVSETAIMDAVRFLFFRMKVVVEPSGVLGLAAILSGEVAPKAKTGIILSGGNVDAETMGLILGS